LSLKNDLEMVKEELNSEEKFFEKAVVTEKFIKKYKNVMIGGVVALVIGVSANIAYTFSEQNRISEANSVLSKLQEDTTNKLLAQKLTSLSPTLSDAWKYSVAVVQKDEATFEKLSKSNTFIIKDLASYELANEKKDAKALEDYAVKQNAIYADLAIIQNAVILINDKKIEDAHEKLSMIKETSSLYRVATALRHYGIK